MNPKLRLTPRDRALLVAAPALLVLAGYVFFHAVPTARRCAALRARHAGLGTPAQLEASRLDLESRLQEAADRLAREEALEAERHAATTPPASPAARLEGLADLFHRHGGTVVASGLHAGEAPASDPFFAAARPAPPPAADLSPPALLSRACGGSRKPLRWTLAVEAPYPALAAALAELAGESEAVVDALEIAVPDTDGAPFSWSLSIWM
ncbi:MAG: hypothetical protein ACOX5G_04660 [Kiritimatiellia bacterium]|jgi:hypothetical protein